MVARHWFLLSVTVAAGCGARTPLEAASGSFASGAVGSTSAANGSGGAPSTSSSSGDVGGMGLTSPQASSTATSTAGAGGMGTGGGVVAKACAAPMLEAPVLALAEPNDATQPNLVAVQASDATAALVYAGHALQDPGPRVARVAAFDAFDAWPPPLPAPTTLTDSSHVPASCDSLVAGSAAVGGDSFAILFGEPGDFSSSYRTAHVTGAIEDPTDMMKGGTVLFTVANEQISGFMNGVSAPSGTEFAFDFSAFSSHGGPNYFEDGCAKTPNAADATPRGDGWLLAAATGTKLKVADHDFSCEQDHPEAISATQIWITNAAFAADGNIKLDDFGFVQATAPVTRLRMASRAGGAWLAWSVEDGDSIPVLTLQGNSDVPATALGAVAGDLVPQFFGLGPLGDGALFALVERGENATDVIRLVELDPGGNVLWDVPIDTGGAVDGAITVLASAALDSAVIAWPELAPDATAHTIRIARVDCIAGP